jgi:glc operon protein GlcG
MQQKLSLTLAEAKKASAAAEAYASAHGLKVSIAVVDQSAHVQHIVRMDGAGLLTAEAAIAKAHSTAGSAFPTAYWGTVLREGELSVLQIPGVSTVAGGVPVIIDGECCGAVGVSGAPPHLDVAVAEAGVAAITDTGTEESS